MLEQGKSGRSLPPEEGVATEMCDEGEGKVLLRFGFISHYPTLI